MPSEQICQGDARTGFFEDFDDLALTEIRRSHSHC